MKQITVQGHKGKKFWKILLPNPLASGDIVVIEVNEFWTNRIEPYPQYITQKDKQLVRYHGNVYVYSPYKTKRITTSVHLHSRNIENYTKLKSASLNDGTITYGSYFGVPPFSVVCNIYVYI